MKSILLTILAFFMFSGLVHAEGKSLVPYETREEIYSDMFLLMLSPQIEAAINKYYSKTLTENPQVYPYMIDVVLAKRVDTSFSFIVTVDVTPVVGPHISVGKDRLTFKVSPGIAPSQAKLIKYEHLETHELPSHWKRIVRHT